MEEEDIRREDEDKDKEDYYSLLNSPCYAFHKALEAILNCLGLESSSSSSTTTSEEELDPARTETVEEIGFMEKVTGLRKRRPKPPYSSGRPGQIN